MDDPKDPDTKKPDTPPWAWAALVAAALLIITTGAIVGMVTTNDDGDAAGSPTTGFADTGSGLPPLLPPTVSIPPVTDSPTDTGGVEPIPPATIPTVTSPTTTTPTTPSGAAGTWPAGQNGYTVVLASIPEVAGRSAADAVAHQATTAGLSSVGVLHSSDFSNLRAGFWVTYAGVYSTLSAARAALPQAQGAGFPFGLHASDPALSPFAAKARKRPLSDTTL